MAFRLSKIRATRRAICTVTVAFGLTACGLPSGTIGEQANTGAVVDPNAEVTVALLVPSGSGDGNLDRLAQNFADAARLAVRDNTGARINLKVYSTGGTATRAANAAQTAVDNGAKIIIGPLHRDCWGQRVCAGRYVPKQGQQCGALCGL